MREEILYILEDSQSVLELMLKHGRHIRKRFLHCTVSVSFGVGLHGWESEIIAFKPVVWGYLQILVDLIPGELPCGAEHVAIDPRFINKNQKTLSNWPCTGSSTIGKECNTRRRKL